MLSTLTGGNCSSKFAITTDHTNHAPCKYANQEVGGICYSVPIDNMPSRQMIIGERLLLFFRVESALNNLRMGLWFCWDIELYWSTLGFLIAWQTSDGEAFMIAWGPAMFLLPKSPFATLLKYADKLCCTGQLEWLYSHCKLSDINWWLFKSRATKPYSLVCLNKVALLG